MKYLLIFLQTFFIVSCQAGNTDKGDKQADTMSMISNVDTVDEQAEKPYADSMNVDLASTFTIDLSIEAGRGFSWKIADSSYNNFIKYNGQSFTNTSKNNKVPDGGDGTQQFSFKALNKGTVILKFIYVQPFMKPYPKDAPQKRFLINIK